MRRRFEVFTDASPLGSDVFFEVAVLAVFWKTVGHRNPRSWWDRYGGNGAL